LYTLGRVLFESLRIDDATKLFGLRFNLMLSIALCVFGFAWFVWLGRRPEETLADDPAEPSPAPDADVEADREI
jgi:prolipoprotein diacylglyceryltransferase